MYCRKQEDYPKRIRIGSGKAVHAAKVVHSPERVKYKPGHYGSNSSDYVDEIIPAHDELHSACGMTYGISHKERTELPNTTTITCKCCMQKIGISYKDPGELRNYVLMEKESGYFYKKTKYTSHWVENIAEATFYKNEGHAKAAGRVVKYMDASGNIIPHEDYWKCKYNERIRKGYSRWKGFDSERFEVRPIRIIIEDEEAEVENSKDGDI